MTEQETDVTPTDSSAVDPGAQPADSPTADHQDATADSSSASDGAAEPSLSDVIEQALGAEESPTSEDDGETKPKEQDSKAEAEEEGDLSDEPTEEEMKDAAPKTRRRIENLLDQRRELRDQVSALEQRATQWDRIEEFRKANGLQEQSVANAIQIAALIENEPDRAFQVIDRLHGLLGQRVGAALPDDLRQAVQRGEITRERAFELSKAQARSQFFEQRQQSLAEQRQQEQEAQRLDSQTRTLADASTAWDQQKAASDPDWQLKRQEVATRVERRLKAEGLPQSPQDMQKVLEEELAQVEAFAKQFRQPARPVRPSPEGASPRDAAPRAPKDHVDAVKQALGM